jgi:hypothetical protein
MKIDLYKLSDRLCKLGGLAFLIHWVYPAAPDFLMGFAAIAIIAGLVVTLADEITARKQRERAAKPAIEPR